MKKLSIMFAIEGIDYNFRSELSPDNPQPVTRLKPLRSREAHKPNHHVEGSISLYQATRDDKIA